MLHAPEQLRIRFIAVHFLLFIAMVVPLFGNVLQKGNEACALRDHALHVRELEVAMCIHKTRYQDAFQLFSIRYVLLVQRYDSSIGR